MPPLSDTEACQGLLRDNPWWRTGKPPDAPQEHFRACYPAFADLAQNRRIRRSIILMGPRRVGKTVMLQQFIAERIAAGDDPRSVFFVSLDLPLYDGRPLQALLDLCAAAAGGDGPPKVVVFDEIQYLQDWQVHLKTLTDRHPGTRFIASGSAAAALRRRSRESGAGRFTAFRLPALSFAEYLEFRGLEDELVRRTDADPEDWMALLAPEIAEDADCFAQPYAARDIRALNAHFIDYLNFGGYPEVAAQPQMPKEAYRLLVGRDIIGQALLRDLPGHYGIRDTRELARLFAHLAYRTGQEMNLDKLAQASEIDKVTLRRYLEYLEAAFLIARIRRTDNTAKNFKRERMFKTYLTSPSMRAALYAPVRGGDDAAGALVETAIAAQWLHSDLAQRLRYAHWKEDGAHREVDLVCLEPSLRRCLWACEIKWSDQAAARPRMLDGLLALARAQRCRAGHATRTTAGRRALGGMSVAHFPCAVHCYAVGKMLAEEQRRLFAA